MGGGEGGGRNGGGRRITSGWGVDDEKLTPPPLPPGCFANETRAWATKDTCDGSTCDGLALTWTCCPLALLAVLKIRISLVLATAAARSSGRGSGGGWEVWGGGCTGCSSGGGGSTCIDRGSGCSLISWLHLFSSSIFFCCIITIWCCIGCWCWCGGANAEVENLRWLSWKIIWIYRPKKSFEKKKRTRKKQEQRCQRSWYQKKIKNKEMCNEII